MSGTQYYSCTIRINENISHLPKLSFTITSELDYTQVEGIMQQVVKLKKQLDKFICCYDIEDTDNDLDNELSKFYESYGFHIDLQPYANLSWCDKVLMLLHILMKEKTSENYYITDENIIEIECK